MSATGTEQAYDDEIAPKLREIVDRCKELGIHMVAHVEWADSGSGITQFVPDGASVQMRMTQLAAHCHGNFDALGMNLLRSDIDCKASVLLHHYANQTEQI